MTYWIRLFICLPEDVLRLLFEVAFIKRSLLDIWCVLIAEEAMKC